MESNQLLHLDIRTDPYWDIPQAIPVTTMLSLFERSGCCLQVLSLVGIAPPADDLSNLLQAMPSLERLSLFFKMRWMDAAFMDDIFNRIFRTIPGGDVVSLEGATPKPFLPNLQILDCRAQNHQLVTPFSWDRIPQHYRQGHRRSLTLKSSASTIHIKIGTALELVQLVDEGVDLQIVDKETGLDFLEKLRNLTSKQLADMEFRTARRT
ncbi:hypothetical protein M413DRAFT_13480 [Hebeloma cylindrosporum]|uniref:F-box domain-containing protein n=1 Tax=Hebeloma cylindrosporum TaxID=76867 RepID=A0A0C3BZ70_HEBCY|nr:hypothetical protein M413DRAFT_13480 [Hebeloma cylindrosporum h7]